MRPTVLSLFLLTFTAIHAAFAAPARAQEQAQQQEPDPERCREHAEWRQLDFWIGSWDVIHPEDGRRLGVNVIEPMLNGCALMENWTSVRGGTGKSLNFYDPQRRTWRQVWVDAFGSVLDYRSGEFRDGAMHFNGITISPAGDTTFQRLTFHHVSADTVRQVFHSSQDGGATWTEDWEGIYVRRAAGSQGGGAGPLAEASRSRTSPRMRACPASASARLVQYQLPCVSSGSPVTSVANGAARSPALRPWLIPLKVVATQTVRPGGV